ncbi:MAG: hypothetical protein J3K34DRAFT_516640 [Monoraphidium minutum]|nr:MAG: hypothetical protein J3K34DRAFT_516640 [Monoraphidium minutum]
MHAKVCDMLCTVQCVAGALQYTPTRCPVHELRARYCVTPPLLLCGVRAQPCCAAVRPVHACCGGGTARGGVGRAPADNNPSDTWLRGFVTYVSVPPSVIEGAGMGSCVPNVDPRAAARAAALNNGHVAPATSSGSSSDGGAAGATAAGPLLSDEAAAVATLAASLALGALLSGAGLGMDESLPPGARRVSSLLGWSYFSAWTISFAPQIVDNQRTRDVSGLSPDYILFSAIGYGCYTAYTAALLFSDDVRASYAAAHGGATPGVSPCDFAFAAGAAAATLLVAGQYAAMAGPGALRLSPFAAAVAAAVALACGGSAALIHAACDGTPDCAAWLPLLGLLGGVKIAMTLVKYTPQVIHNHTRRSTQGWSLTTVLLDVAGGGLSLGQMLLDAAARHDLAVVTGNPAKMWVAALSLGYDAVFIAQHYWAYRDKQGGAARGPGGGAPDQLAAAVAPPVYGAPLRAPRFAAVPALAASVLRPGARGAPPRRP